MKKILLLTVLVTLMSTVAFGKKLIAEGKTFSAFGDYRIETAENPFQFTGEDCTAYKIRYENSDMEVTVVVCKEKKCRKYLVLSDKLSVQYVCNPTYFGVERLDATLEHQGYKTSDETLNKSEYYHQKVISSAHQNENEAARLIAANFPFLINVNNTLTADR